MKTQQDFKKLFRLNKLPEFEDLTESQKSLVSEEEYKKVAFILPPNWKIRITQNSKRFLDKWRYTLSIVIISNRSIIEII